MGMLKVGQSGKFQVKILERDNPAVMAVYNDSFDSSWQNLNWNFIFNNTQGELQIDNYREHDRMGYRSSMQDGSGNTEWNYDPRGNIIREIKNITLGGGSFLTQWNYNSAGLVTSLTYPGNRNREAGEEVQLHLKQAHAVGDYDQIYQLIHRQPIRQHRSVSGLVLE